MADFETNVPSNVNMWTVNPLNTDFSSKWQIYLLI